MIFNVYKKLSLLYDFPKLIKLDFGNFTFIIILQVNVKLLKQLGSVDAFSVLFLIRRLDNLKSAQFFKILASNQTQFVTFF